MARALRCVDRRYAVARLSATGLLVHLRQGVGRVGLAVALAGLLAHAVQAQTPSPLMEWQYSAGVPLMVRFLEPLPKWQVTLGPAFEIRPDYEGASTYRVDPGATIDLRYRDLLFASTGEGIGVNVFSSRLYRAGVAIAYDLGRDDHDSDRLRGLGDIGWAPEPKLFGELVLFPVVLRADIRRAIGGHDGWIGDLGAYMPIAGSKEFVVFVGPSVTFADETYMRHYFGISRDQSQRSGLPTYHAGAGLKQAGFGASADWFFTDHWFLGGDVAAERLLGDAADSPITQDKWQLSLSFTLSYRF